MLSFVHYCLCQWTEFSSERMLGLLERLSECNDLRHLRLSSAKDGVTGLPQTNWLYKCIPAESSWPDGPLSPKCIISYLCCTRESSTAVSWYLVHASYTAEGGSFWFPGQMIPKDLRQWIP